MFKGLQSLTKLVASSQSLNYTRRGFFQKFLFPTDRQQRVEYLRSNNILVGSPEFDKFYSELPPTQLSKETGLSDALLDDPLLHVSVIKYNKNVIEKYNLTPEQENEVLDKYEISAGEESLEFLINLPVPEHNFEELPIIKAFEGVAKH
ncbi:cytochrome c oxidase subunit IV [Tieghemostelium lacteum]|uniref:Cytochrome c oxidase subunit IV n=1 Tax=Tieghemostelium lacteum TaxID=361077 RepID=A0A152A745_TIELA|nr:cytochrome c oxidase subunit IV [Tieghemostelium lacteum]|eukprot:KYR01945.1 cytochrome c oxidase subunit IV [Tieghemostelium lacteum]